MVQTPAKSQRARNRQAYNLLKKQSATSNGSLPLNGQSLKHSASMWQSLSSKQLLEMSETELSDLEQNLSQSEKVQLAQKLQAALMEVSQQPVLNWSQPKQTLPSFPPEAPIPSIDASSDVTSTGSHQENISYTARSEDEPPSYVALLTPLSGKHLRQMQDIEMLLALVAGGFEMAAEMSGSVNFRKDADTIGKYGEKVAESWARLGRKYPWMYKAIDRVCGVSQAGSMMASTGLLIRELMKNHGITLPTIRRTRVEPQPVPIEHAA